MSGCRRFAIQARWVRGWMSGPTGYSSTTDHLGQTSKQIFSTMRRALTSKAFLVQAQANTDHSRCVRVCMRACVRITLFFP